jgi:hypothetical protein
MEVFRSGGMEGNAENELVGITSAQMGMTRVIIRELELPI